MDFSYHIVLVITLGESCKSLYLFPLCPDQPIYFIQQREAQEDETAQYKSQAERYAGVLRRNDLAGGEEIQYLKLFVLFFVAFPSLTLFSCKEGC